MLDKKKIQVIFLFKFKMGRKAVKTTCNINNAFSPGTADEHILQWWVRFSSVQFSSVAQSCLTLCDPMNRSMPGLPVHHQLPEFTQTHVHRISDEEVLQRRREPWRWGAQWSAMGSSQLPTSWEQSSKLILLQLREKLLKNFNIDHCMVIVHLKQIGKVRKLDKWVPHELIRNQKNHHFEVSSSLILHNNNKPFLYWIVICDRQRISWWPA